MLNKDKEGRCGLNVPAVVSSWASAVGCVWIQSSVREMSVRVTALPGGNLEENQVVATFINIQGGCRVGGGSLTDLKSRMRMDLLAERHTSYKATPSTGGGLASPLKKQGHHLPQGPSVDGKEPPTFPRPQMSPVSGLKPCSR